MKGLRCWLWMGCIGAALLGAPAAHADGGRITFSGAVVEPTCAVSEDTIASLLSQVEPSVRPAVHGRCKATVAGTAEGSAVYYTVILSVLPPNAAGMDRLLGYYSGYLSVSDSGQAHLLTQVFY